MKTASAKAKGRKLQYWVCCKISELFDIKFDQQDDQCPIHSREMGQSGVDVYFRNKKYYDKFPFDIECKATERFQIYKDIEQAKQNMKEGRDWLLFHRKNRSEPIVVLDAECFFKLLKRNYKGNM